MIKIDNTTEIYMELQLDPTMHTVFRLDGHGFSRLVKVLELKKPFDDRFTESMKSTLVSCISTFNFTLGFTGSDEITYYLEPQSSGLPFSGRAQKMVSLLAGKVSVTFYAEMSKRYGPDMLHHLPHFDCRVFQFHTFGEVLENISERVVFTLKNARLMLVQQYYSQKQLTGIPSRMAIEMLQKEKDIDFNVVISPDNRVGNVLIYETRECEKEIELSSGEKRMIRYQRRIPVLLNMSPTEVLGIESAKMLDGQK